MDIHPKHSIAAVTICATNYLGKALALKQSYVAHHPESDFYILLIAVRSNTFPSLPPDVQFLWADDLGIDKFSHCAMKFDVIELSTAIKASALSKLLSDYAKVLYIDPDIYFYDNLEPVLEALESSSVVVTPHTLTPVMDGFTPSDMDFLRMGSFNLGFIGVRKCDEAFRFLDWWSQRCLQYGYYEPQVGLAVDQKWVDLAPALFPGLKILRDPGLNVAYWNLHERVISKRDERWFVNDEVPLRFFHYSSFVVTNPQAIANRQSRFIAGSRPDLQELLDGYAESLKNNEFERYSGQPYPFDYFECGIYVPPTLRRFYGALESSFPEEDPFVCGSELQQFAICHGLAGEEIQAMPRRTLRDMGQGQYSRAIRIISFGLRFILRLVGPNRYFLLMRYLAHISSIRNQGGLFPKLQPQNGVR